MKITPFFSWFFWNPSREVFTIPVVDHPIAWYGLFFVTGFLFGYWLVLRFLRQDLETWGVERPREKALFLTDRLCWFVVAGTILGARAGEVLFYDWDYYREHLGQIVQIWKGGLSSHGGGIGIMIALWLYQMRYRKEYPFLSFFSLLDRIVVPTGLAGFCIRLGNFFNQEIIGTPTQMPWGVIFLQPADGSLPEPRHPVQLYEGIAYLAIFAVMLLLRPWALRRFRPGFLSGVFLVLVFSSRFFLEYFKASFPGAGFVSFAMQQGQYLSIPYILGGVALMVYASWPGTPITVATSSKRSRDVR